MTGAQLNNEFRPYYTVRDNYMVWHDYAVIKLNYLFESLNKIGLVKRLDALRLWVNTGTVNVTVNGADSANVAYNLTPANNTFSNACPILVNHQVAGTSAGIVPATTTNIVAGLYIARPPTTSFAGINLAASIVQHPRTNCRLYYSQVTVDPQKSIDFQWKSPFDTCPATMSPISLTNLQVSIGGQNVLNSTLNMTYENFLEQVNLAEQLTSSDFGVSTGLISQGYWEMSKWYLVNVEGGNIADKLQPRNINVSFNNNSNVAIDVIIFTFYSDQLTIDVETGTVTK